MSITPTVTIASTPSAPEEIMTGKIVNHVPRLLQERSLNAQDLMFGARLAPSTAYSWANEKNPPSRVDLDILAKICDFLGVGISDVLEYKPEER